MSQSATTVTAPNPTPPTNFSCTGVTGPNPPNFTKNTMNDTKNWGPGTANPPVFTPTSPPPYFDDGAAGSLVAFAASTAALASGSGATAGGTEGTYPGTGTAPFNANLVGAVPASTSATAEGRGTEVVVTATVPNPSPNGQLQTVSCLGNYTNLVSSSPNSQHASSLSPAAAATITTLAPNNTASGGGTLALTVTGTNFTPQSVVYVNGVAQVTVYVSPTSLTVAAAPKKATAGTLPVFVRTAGTVETAASTWTFT